LPITAISRFSSSCTAPKSGEGAAWPAGAAWAGDAGSRGDLPFADELDAAARKSARLKRTVYVSFKRVTPSARCVAGCESTSLRSFAANQNYVPSSLTFADGQIRKSSRRDRSSPRYGRERGQILSESSAGHPRGRSDAPVSHWAARRRKSKKKIKNHQAGRRRCLTLNLHLLGTKDFFQSGYSRKRGKARSSRIRW